MKKKKVRKSFNGFAQGTVLKYVYNGVQRFGEVVYSGKVFTTVIHPFEPYLPTTNKITIRNTNVVTV